MNRKITPKRWVLIAALAALVAVIARYLWKRRSERRV